MSYIGDIVKVRRIIPVKNLDGTWGRLDTSGCITVRTIASNREVYLCEFFLHKSSNRRWYEEKYYDVSDRSEAREITLDQAMDRLIGSSFSRLAKFRVLEDLPDVSSTATPPHGGSIVVKCLKCRVMSSSVNCSRSNTEKTIVRAMKKVNWALSGREIAERAGLKYNSCFRALLARLVSSSVVAKVTGKTGYVLTDKVVS